MTSLDSKLFEWQRLRMQCDAVRARLRQAMGSASEEAAVATLHADLLRLEGETAALLVQLDALRREQAARGPRG